jgi:2'-5' RNA ligase
VPDRVSPPTFRILHAGSGVCIAFWIPADVASTMVIADGEKAEDLHVTLAYLGKPEEIGEEKIAAARAAVMAVAAASAPLDGSIGGLGRFSASDTSDGKDVLYASIDVPGLGAFRERLCDALRTTGCAPSDAHDFTPHVTLAYVEPSAESPIDRIESRDLRIDAITFAVAAERSVYPLAAAEQRDDATDASLTAGGGGLPPTVGVPAGKRPKKSPLKLLPVDQPRVIAPGSANPRAEDVSTTAPQASPQREFRFSTRILRADTARKVVYGVVYPPFDPKAGQSYPIETINDVVDTWGTFMRPSTVEEMAHSFLRFSRNIDQQHDATTRAGDPIESYIADDKSEFTPGAWILVVKVADDIWPKVTSGELNGFSIDVLAGRIPTAVKVTGRGKTVDLNGVTEPPFFPRETTVDGEATLRLDELVDTRPYFVSLVGAAANRRDFERRATEFPVVRFQPEQPMSVESRSVVPYKKTPEGGGDTWDKSVEDGKVRKWAGVDADEPSSEAWSKYGTAFLFVTGDADKFGSYSEMHHCVVDGELKLHRKGLAAAAQRLDATDVSDADKAKGRTHLEKHYHDLDLKAPWESASAEKKAAAVARSDDPSASGPPLAVEVRDGKVTITAEEGASLEGMKPATKGWLRRFFGSLLGLDENALRSDGSPPPAIAASLPPVVTVPTIRKETSMSTNPESRAIAVVKRHKDLITRYTGDGGPIDFSVEWEKEDYTEELSDAHWLLSDVLYSIWWNYDSYASWDAMLQAMAKAMNEFLAAVAVIPSEVGKEDAVALARSSVVRMMIAVPSLDAVLRAGKKYSADTVAKLTSAHAKMEAAYSEMCALMSDVNGADDKGDDEVKPPVDETKEKPAGTDGAAGDDEKVLKEKAAAAARAAASVPPAAQVALDATKRELDEVNKRISALDAQPAATAPATEAPPVVAPVVEDPILVETKRLQASVDEAKKKLDAIEKRRNGSAQVTGNGSAPATPAKRVVEKDWAGGISFGPTMSPRKIDG